MRYLTGFVSDGEYVKYTVYKTTNILNDKIYIGKHQTLNPFDSYLGSGRALLKAIKKYGKENFVKEILFVFDSEEEMNLKESEIVTEEFIASDSNYNMGVGGEGGAHFKGRLHSEETKKIISSKIKERGFVPSESFYENKYEFPKGNDYWKFRNNGEHSSLSQEHKNKIANTLLKTASQEEGRTVGVRFYESKNSWEAYIQKGKIRKRKYFKSFEEALEKRIEWEIELYGEAFQRNNCCGVAQ